MICSSAKLQSIRWVKEKRQQKIFSRESQLIQKNKGKQSQL